MKQKHNKTYRFSITLLERDAQGKLTGRKKHFSSDNSYKIWEFFNRNYDVKLKKRKSGSAGKSSEKDIKKWVTESQKHSEKVKKRKQGED